MKIKNIKYMALVAVLGLGVTSCEDFLDRPTEDNYNQSNFYQNDTQCIQGVNFLYNSPWYDFQHEDGIFCAESASPSDIQGTGGGLDTKK